MKPLQLGRWLGLQIEVLPSAWLGMALSWAGGALAYGALGAFSAADAVLFGLALAGLHVGATLVHHYGHAFAAAQTGHPMAGVRFRFGIATSLYPDNEPQLPARVHIRRALGGPIASVVLAMIAGGAAVILRSAGSQAWTLALITALDSLLVVGLGALIPLGFTDGSTLLYWWGRR